MLMFSRNGSATGDIHGGGSNSTHATPQHHRLSTSSTTMMSPRGVYLSVNSSSNSPGGYSNRGNGRNSYIDTTYTKNINTSKGSYPTSPPINKVQQNGSNCPPNTEQKTSIFKRSTSRSTMKKNRPHSWHSTLQKGFNRARSRSRGRDEREHRRGEKEQQAYSSNNKGRKTTTLEGALISLFHSTIPTFLNLSVNAIKEYSGYCWELNTHFF